MIYFIKNVSKEEISEKISKCKFCLMLFFGSPEDTNCVVTVASFFAGVPSTIGTVIRKGSFSVLTKQMPTKLTI